MTDDEWRVVPGWPDYAVNQLGQVKRVTAGAGRARQGALLRWRWSTGVGYPSVSLAKNSRAKHWFVHRLVALAFIGPCPDGQEVNHKNGDKSDPRLENLEYVSRSANLRHAFASGLKDARGEKNARARLCAEDVVAIRVEYTGAYGQCAALARKFGVSHSAIQDIVHGRRWLTAA